MRTTKNHLQYKNKRALGISEEDAIAKNKHKYMCKVGGEQDLKLGEMVYIDIISQKNPSYGVSNNWIFIQDLEIRQSGLSS